jgi:hypothetical protein
VRVALVDLDDPPAWFVRRQQQDHLTADQARQFAGTDGEQGVTRSPGVGAAARQLTRA